MTASLISESMNVTQIGFIGAGQMAQALAAGIAQSHSDTRFLISDPSDAAKNSFSQLVGEQRVQRAASNDDVFANCETVFLAIKPQYLVAALTDVDLKKRAHPLVVSVMAGVTIARIAELSGVDRVIRVMPNTPCLIGQGACAMACSTAASAEDAATIQGYLESVGVVVNVAEPLLDCVTGLSGSGPAYVFSFIESLVQGAVLTGLPIQTAEKLAIQTVIGAAQMLLQSGEHPAVLRDRVSSPGGTTIAGLKELENKNFRNAVMSAVLAATERARELGKQS